MTKVYTIWVHGPFLAPRAPALDARPQILPHCVGLAAFSEDLTMSFLIGTKILLFCCDEKGTPKPENLQND